MSKAAASTSSHKSSFSAAALVRSRNTLTFRLHPKQLVAFRSKATEILYRGAAGGGKPHLMRAAAIFGGSVIAGLRVLFLLPYQQQSPFRELPQFVVLPEE